MFLFTSCDLVFFFSKTNIYLIIIVIHCTRPTICNNRCSRMTFACCCRLYCADGLAMHRYHFIVWITQCQIDLQFNQKCIYFWLFLQSMNECEFAYRNGGRHRWSIRWLCSCTIIFTIFRLFFNTGFRWIIWDNFCKKKTRLITNTYNANAKFIIMY